jgi:hypothetical protein
MPDYHEDFSAMLEVIEEYGGAGSMTHFPNMSKKEIESMGMDLAKATSDQLKQAKKSVRDKFLAVIMLTGANGAKYNDLKRNMKENFVTGTSTYPKSPEAVLRILNAYQPPVGWGTEGNKMPEMGQRKEPCSRRPKEGKIPGRQGSTATSAGRRGTSHGSAPRTRRKKKNKCTRT